MGEKTAEFLNIFVGLRKIIAWFTILTVSVIFRIKGYINGAEFVDLSKATFLGFVAGNMTEHVSETVKEYLNSNGKKVKEVVEDIEESNKNVS